MPAADPARDSSSIPESSSAKPANQNGGEIVQPPDLAGEWLPTGVLKPWAKNPRKNDGEPVDKVAESIKRFGFSAPIVARRANYEIIAGHTRWKAAKKLGLDRVPVRLLDIDEKNAHLLAVADNRLTELTAWDDAGVHEVLAQYDAADQLLAGWSQKDIEELEKSRRGAAEDVEEDEVPELPKNPITRRGDVWTLGRHRIICGDSRDPLDVSKLVGNAKVNLAFTSPPYASQREYDEASGFKPIHPDEFVAWFCAVQANVRSVLASDGSWFVNIKPHSDGLDTSLYVMDLVTAHVREWGWHLASEFCWSRTGVPGLPARRFKNQFEPVYQFAQAEWKFRPQAVMHASDSVPSYDKKNSLAHGLKRAAGGGHGPAWENKPEEGLAYPGNLLPTFKNSEKGTGHTATFPVGLPSFFIRAYTDPSDNVYEPFAGSGTTLIAAERLDRTCYGIELSPAYCDVIVERWQNLTGGKAERGAA